MAKVDKQLIAVLRDIRPENIEQIGQVFSRDSQIPIAGKCFKYIEISFKSPEPIKSIEKLVSSPNVSLTIGGGDIDNLDQIKQVKDAAGKFIVSSYFDEKIVTTAKDAGLICCVGVSDLPNLTKALAAGADWIKVSPVSQFNRETIKYFRRQVPADKKMYLVGGVQSSYLGSFYTAGVDLIGFEDIDFKIRSGFSEVQYQIGEICNQYHETMRKIEHYGIENFD